RHIEFYFRSDEHPDPFVHGFPIQHRKGRWYFHRVGRGYRGGSYKGLDLTFGDPHSLGGILFRAAETEKGFRIQGPSKLVDFVLAATKSKTVAELDAAIGLRTADDPHSLLRLERATPTALTLVRKRRVGLSMKRATLQSEHAN